MTNASAPLITIGPRVRKSPFFDATIRYGARAFTIYNHTYLPTLYTDPVEEYWHLVNGVTLWDVACQRQVEITGPDAEQFAQLLTPRNLATCAPGRCRYVLLCDDRGGIVNDAVLLRLEAERFWLSPGDGDVLLWALGVAVHSGLDVTVEEPDVSPLQLQGPLAPAVAEALFGGAATELGFFRCRELELDGIPIVLSRTGWSSEVGFELYLRDARHGEALWEAVMRAGQPHGIAPVAPSTIRSIEGALLSYGADMTREDNPFDLGLERLVNLDAPTTFIGRAALERIAAEGPRRRLVGLELEGEPMSAPNAHRWPVARRGTRVGHLTRAVHSPRLARNIGLANVPVEDAEPGTGLVVESPVGTVAATVVPTPFVPPPD